MLRTVVPYLLLMLPMVITHLIPALIMYAPEVRFLGGIVRLLVRITAVDESGRNIMKGRSAACSSRVLSCWRYVEERAAFRACAGRGAFVAAQ